MNKLLELIRNLFLPVHYDDEEQNWIAKVISIVSLLTILGLNILIIYRLIAKHFLDVVPLIFICVIIFIAYIILHKRKILWLTIIVLWCVLIFVNHQAISNDGIHDIVYFIIPGIFIVASLLLPKFHYATIVTAAILAILTIGYLEISNVIKNYYSIRTTWAEILDIVVMLSIIAISIWFLSNNLRSSISRIRKNEKEIRIQTDLLRISQKRYQVLFEGANDAIFILSGDKIIECNFMALKIFKSERSTDLIEHFIWELSPINQPDNRSSKEKINEILNSIIEGKSQHFYWKFLKGANVHFDADVSISKFEFGDEVFYQALVKDITDQKQAEIRLNLFSQTIKSIGECITITDLNNIILFVNEAFLTTYGYDYDEIIGKSIDIVNVDPTIRGKVVIDATLKGGWQGEVLNRKKDGTVFPIYLSTSVVNDEDGKVIALVGVATDISERKKVEKVLEVSEKKYQDIVKWAPVGIYQSTKSGKLLNANRSITNMLGFENPNDIIGCDMGREIYYDEKDREQFINQHNAIGENISLSFETKWKRKDGSYLWVLITAHDVRDKAKEILYYEGFVFDITERKKTEEALGESEERYRLLVENSTDIVSEISSDGNILYISPNIKSVLDYDADEFIKLKEIKNLFSANKDNIINNTSNNYIFKLKDKSGKWHWFESSSRVYKISSGEQRIVMFSRDITQRKKAEKELERSKKQLQLFTEHLEHILEEEKKRISRELHDELGQLLTILKFDLSWLRLEGAKGNTEIISKTDAMMESVNEALASVKRISKEIRPPQLDALGLSGAIQWDIDQIEKKTGFKGYVKVEPEDFSVKGQISTVLYRVFREALTNVVRHSQAQHVFIRLIKKPQSIILTVSDDGRGITKKEIKGEKSLGLVGIRERIRIVGGTFQIEGRPDKGTVLSVEVPIEKKKNGESEL